MKKISFEVTHQNENMRFVQGFIKCADMLPESSEMYLVEYYVMTYSGEKSIEELQEIVKEAFEAHGSKVVSVKARPF